MNKKILLFGLFIVALLLPTISFGMVANIQSLGAAIVRVIASIFGVVAVVCFVFAGIMFLTAQGDAAKLQTARAAVVWGFVGVVVGIVAFSIITIVSNMLN